MLTKFQWMKTLAMVLRLEFNTMSGKPLISLELLKGLDFQAMQVEELISYKAGDGDEFDSIEGGEEF